MRKTKNIGVGIIIINQNGDFLLHLRDANTPLMTGQWSLVGGGMEPGETPKEAAHREITEETSLVAHDVVKVGSLSFDENWDALIFQAKVDTLGATMILGEGKKLQFFSHDDVSKLLNSLNYTNPFLEFLKKYLKQVAS